MLGVLRFSDIQSHLWISILLKIEQFLSHHHSMKCFYQTIAKIDFYYCFDKKKRLPETKTSILILAETERMTRELEEIHSRFDKAQIELTTMTEEKDRVEVEARKFRNQLDHARQSLDNTYESETRIRQELELVKRDYSKLQDKLDQAEAELR